MAEDKRAEIMEKVRKLLSKAESTTYGPEQEALLGKADKLMVQYAIAQFEIDSMVDPTQRAKPEQYNFPVCESGSHLWNELTQLSGAVCDFFDCKVVYSGLHLKGRYPITAMMVGFPESVRSAEQLFQSLKIQLMGQLNPKYESTRSCADNIVVMKDAGMKWSDIFAELKRGAPHDVQAESLSDGMEERSKLGRIKTVYDNRKKALGEPPTKVSPKNYQTNFAAAFAAEVHLRMLEVKRARSQDEVTETGTSVALVLRSRQEEVDEMYEDLWGGKVRNMAHAGGKVNHAARQAGAKAGRNADLSGATRNVGGTKGALT